jgi:threonine/homoserine/homoserine lactone efflux protein
MTLLSISGLAAAMFLLAITPGPGVFATVSKALSSGFKSTLPVVFGIVIGDLIFLLFAIYGLSAIAETFNTIFLTIKYLGGAYLVWFGFKLWRSSAERVDIAAIKLQSGRAGFLGGLSITLGNPKVIIFYLSFLPTFVHLDQLSTIDVVSVASVVSLVLGSVMLFYAYTASRTRELFKSAKAQNKMNRVAGAAMIGAGALLLTKA